MSDFELLHGAATGAAIGTRFAAERLAELYTFPDPVPARGWVRGSMLSTIDGAGAGPDGRSASISGPPDRLVLAALRHTADVVLVGIGTARTEGYRRVKARDAFAAARAAHGQPPAPALAVVTGSGDVPQALLDPAPDEVGDLLVIVHEDTPADRVAELRRRLGADAVFSAGETTVEPDAAVEGLTRRGLTRIVCEGGPTWLATLEEAGRLDELCLTTSPLIVSGDTGRILRGDGPGHEPRRATLTQLLLAEEMLFARWTLQSPAEHA